MGSESACQPAPGNVERVICVRSLRVLVGRIVALPEFSKLALHLIAAISREPSMEENVVLDGLLRYPLIGSLVQQFLICRNMGSSASSVGTK